MRKLFTITLLFLSICLTKAQELITFPFPDSIAQNKDFTVKVRVPGKQWQELYEYDARVDMHNVRHTSMVNFDFSEKVEVSVTSNKSPVNSVQIRPLSYNIKPTIKGNTIFFNLDKPCNISVEVNGDIFHNLHVFTNFPETYKPDPKDTSIIYLGPGFHTFEQNTLNVPSGKTLYLAGGAVLKAGIKCVNAHDVRICGRGIVFQPVDGVLIEYSDSVKVEDLIFINPSHYTVLSGQSKNITIRNIRSFSCKGWSDGIDLFCNSNVLIEGVFMRNSDDCIAIYAHRWKYFGDCRNVIVRNSTLWADVAHPINIGVHGNSEPGKSETIENISFHNIDILNQDEPQLCCRGCMCIVVSDGNLARNIRFENIRVEDIERGQLLSLRVEFNKKYAKAPGRGIEDVYFKNVSYNGSRASLSIIEGYDETRMVKNIVFENLVINGKTIYDNMKKPGYMPASDFADIYIGPHVEGLKFISTPDTVKETPK
jgi:hypothetical protein